MIRRDRVLLLAAASLLALPPALCAQHPLDAQDEVDATGEAKRIASALLEGSEAEGEAAAADAFLLAGVTIWGLPDGRTRAGVPPSLPVRIHASEVARLARSIRARTRAEFNVTLAEFGEGLVSLGWKPASARTGGEALAAVLGHAVLIGADEEHNPESFVPLLLAELNERLAPERGLAAYDWEPETVRAGEVELSELEVRLLSAMLLRTSLLHQATSRSRDSGNGTAFVPDATFGRGPFVAPLMLPGLGTPCSDWLDDLPEIAQPNANYGADAGSSWLLDRALNAAGEVVGGLVGGATVIIKIAKIVSSTLDEKVAFELVSSVDTAYYSPFGKPRANELSFTASAYIPEAARGWTDDVAMADCLKFLGFTLPDSYETLKKGVGQWHVVWGTNTIGPHATWGLDKNGDFVTHTSFSKKVKFADDRWSSSFRVDMASEKRELRAGQPVVERYGEIPMWAKLDQSQPPNYDMLMKAIAAGAAFGGPALGVGLTFGTLTVETLAGLWQKFSARTARRTVDVVWNEPGVAGWYGTIMLEHDLDMRRDTVMIAESGRTREKSNQRIVQRITLRVVPEDDETGSRLTVQKTAATEEYQRSDSEGKCRANLPGEYAINTGHESESKTELSARGRGYVSVAVAVEDDGAYSVGWSGSLPTLVVSGSVHEWARSWGSCDGSNPEPFVKNVSGQYREELTGFIPRDFEGRAAPGAKALKGEHKDALGWTIRWQLRYQGQDDG